MGAAETQGEPRGLHTPRRPRETGRQPGTFMARPLELILRGALLFVLVFLVYRPVGIRRLRRAETTPPTGRFPHRRRPGASTGALPMSAEGQTNAPWIAAPPEIE